MSTDYEYALAREMAAHGSSDEAIREALANAMEFTRQGDDPEQELGPPEEYAASFPVAVKSGFGWPGIGFALGILWLVGVVVAVKGFDASLPVAWGRRAPFGIVALTPLLLLSLCGVLGAAMAARRRSDRLLRSLRSSEDRCLVGETRVLVNGSVGSGLRLLAPVHAA